MKGIPKIILKINLKTMPSKPFNFLAAKLDKVDLVHESLWFYEVKNKNVYFLKI